MGACMYLLVVTRNGTFVHTFSATSFKPWDAKILDPLKNHAAVAQ